MLGLETRVIPLDTRGTPPPAPTLGDPSIDPSLDARDTVELLREGEGDNM